MRKTAIFVDGGFYRKRAKNLWGNKTPKDRAKELHAYCAEHIKQKRRQDKNQGIEEARELYRIFYYDCDPLSKVVYHPLTKKNTDFSRTDTYKWTMDFFSYLKEQRKMCLRKGTLLDSDATYVIHGEKMKALLSGKLSISELKEDDFSPSWRQKGVDMKLGVDMASLAYKHQVDQIILIAGDSDFVPAAKIARREGIDVILDPMWQTSIAENLKEHIDGIRSCWKKRDSSKKKPRLSIMRGTFCIRKGVCDDTQDFYF